MRQRIHALFFFLLHFFQCQGFHVPTSRTKHVSSTTTFVFRGNSNNDDAYSQEQIATANDFLRASRSSFKHVETHTNRLLNRQPLLALAIFVGVGVLTSYLLGFFFLGGYIETWNPAENDSIPYWDDEVLVISRKIGR